MGRKDPDEPETAWPYEDSDPIEPANAPRPYQLRSERRGIEPDEAELARAAALSNPYPAAESTGGPQGAFAREILQRRLQISSATKSTKADSWLNSPRAGKQQPGHGRPQLQLTAHRPAAAPKPVAASEGGAVVVRAKAGPDPSLPKFLGREPQQLVKPAAKAPAPVFAARPYWEDTQLGRPRGATPKADSGGDSQQRERFRLRTRLAWGGALAFALYLAALGFYLYVRITKTLDLGPYRPYAIFVLVVECLGASTVLLYGINLILEAVPPEHEVALATEPRAAGLARELREPYHVRVLIPCYSEPLDILAGTLQGALAADLPRGCRRTVYLCDDGADAAKREVASLGPGVQYVSGRTRPVGEMNGKSGNLNSCLAQIYPPGAPVPSNELVCIFDADQVAGQDFLLRSVALFDGGRDVGMVLSPQAFHNLDGAADVWNHGNTHFWEYMQPGYDALSFISCTGTNFLVRATAFLQAGGSPTYTLTEDFALGMELTKLGWRCRYVRSYLAVGEAPEQLRNIMQQRSRWVKGHFQILFSAAHCPLLQRGLTPLQRLMYVSGVWSYMVGAVSTPLFILIPIITIWAGVFPIIISRSMALALTLYVAALWFANTCNANLWWVYVKAITRSLSSLFTTSGIRFKTTMKGGGVLANSSFRDLWMPCLVLAGLIASIIGGIVRIAAARDFPTALAISVLWAGYQAAPPALVLAYVLLGARSPWLPRACLLAMAASFACGVAAVALLWKSTYADYGYSRVAAASNTAYQAAMVGQLPPDYARPSWRGDALLQEAAAQPFGGAGLAGGWLTGGVAGNLKMSMPTAFATAMLAWGLLTFPPAEPAADAALRQQVQWGADYLLRTAAPLPAGGFALAYQVGNLSVDIDYWGRPEDITGDRPWYLAQLSATAANSSVDLGGAVSAALLAASLAVPNAPNASLYLGTGLQLFQAVAASANNSGAQHNYAAGAIACGVNGTALPACGGDASTLYAATTFNDFAFWAAAWAWKATADPGALAQAQAFQAAFLNGEAAAGLQQPVFNWASPYYAANLLLAQGTTVTSYRLQVEVFLREWVCATKDKSLQLRTTARGRVWAYTDPSLGATANAAFLAVAYASLLRPAAPREADVYTCWALQQVRYMLGDVGRSLVVGTGHQPPGFAGVQSASCPPPPAPCDGISALLSPQPNPLTVTGALIQGSALEDDRVSNVRSDTSNAVQVEYNAGLQAALGGIAAYNLNWYQCKLKFGILVDDQTYCSKLPPPPYSQ